MNQLWVDMCSPSWIPLAPPPHPITQGHPSAPALSTLSHALNLDWRSVSHMIIYIFQCSSLKSSHPRLLPQNSKDYSLLLYLSPSPTEFKRLFFTSVSLSLSHIYCHCYHLSKFHIYVLEYCICVFLSDFTLYNRLQFHLPH